MTLSLVLWLALPLLVCVAVLDLLTASPARRARILRRAGLTQQAIANRLGVSRYRVRQYLAA
jgi:predicted transcriptional regulator